MGLSPKRAVAEPKTANDATEEAEETKASAVKTTVKRVMRKSSK